MARKRKTLRSATKLKLERIVRLEMLGVKPREIATELGMKADTIRELIRHPEYAVVRERAVERTYAVATNYFVPSAASQL